MPDLELCVSRAGFAGRRAQIRRAIPLCVDEREPSSAVLSVTLLISY